MAEKEELKDSFTAQFWGHSATKGSLSPSLGDVPDKPDVLKREACGSFPQRCSRKLLLSAVSQRPGGAGELRLYS